MSFKSCISILRGMREQCKQRGCEVLHFPKDDAQGAREFVQGQSPEVAFVCGGVATEVHS